MDAGSEEHFWHLLALALGGRTVGELKNVMSHSEFLRWADYYKQHPFDDFHRYHRPAALVATSMNGADVKSLLDWLEPRYDAPSDSEYSEEDLATFKALGMDKPPKRS